MAALLQAREPRCSQPFVRLAELLDIQEYAGWACLPAALMLQPSAARGAQPFVRLAAKLAKAEPAMQGPQEAERTVQAVLQGRMGFIRKPAAVYLSELVQGATELCLSPLDLEVIETLSLEGEAEIIEQMAQAGEEEDTLLELMEHESDAVVLLDALGVLGGAGRAAEGCEELEPSMQELVRTMEPRRLGWVRRRVAALWLARLAGWFSPPRSGALGASQAVPMPSSPCAPTTRTRLCRSWRASTRSRRPRGRLPRPTWTSTECSSERERPPLAEGGVGPREGAVRVPSHRPGLQSDPGARPSLAPRARLEGVVGGSS